MEFFRLTVTAAPFDANAGGTVPGSGAALVLLKLLEQAIADGDHIHAVIKGSAINNDGNKKVGLYRSKRRRPTACD